MELGEIFSDALTYPLNNIKSLIVYIILGVILGIAVGGTISAIVFTAAAENILALVGSGVIGIIVALFLGFLITGYELDIIKYGINRDANGPGIDPIRQFINGVKLLVVLVVYFIIPIIVASILAIVFQHWLSTLISIILFIIFGLAAFMAQCRLAKTEDLGHALAISEAIGDISRVGIIKLILFLILTAVIVSVLSLIGGLINQWNTIAGGIFLGILGVYSTFFISRATGLLYSDV